MLCFPHLPCCHRSRRGQPKPCGVSNTGTTDGAVNWGVTIAECPAHAPVHPPPEAAQQLGVPGVRAELLSYTTSGKESTATLIRSNLPNPNGALQKGHEYMVFRNDAMIVDWFNRYLRAGA